MRYHLRFKHFHPDVLAATTELFSSRPWDENYDEQTEKFQRWATAVAGLQDVPEPMVLVLNPEIERAIMEHTFDPPANTLLMPKFSVLTMFYQYRLWALQNGRRQYNPDPVADAAGWACSLFYKVRPVSFRRAVRTGRVNVGISAEDLLSTATLDRVRELRLVGDFEAAEAIVRGETPALPDALTEEDEETLSELENAFSDSMPVMSEGQTTGPWTDAEVAVLRQLDAGELTIDEVVAQTGRTKSGIRSALRRVRQAAAE